MSFVTGPKDFAALGDFNAVCAVCGFKYKGSELRKRWDGVYVCDKDYEPRHPQDLIRLPKERIAPGVPTCQPVDVYRAAAPVDPNSL